MSRPLPVVGDYPKWSPAKRVWFLLVASAWALFVVYALVAWVVRGVLWVVASIPPAGWWALTVLAGVWCLVVAIGGEKRYRRGGSR